MRKRLLSTLVLALALLPAHAGRATTTTYTDSTAFGLALPGPSITLDFDSLPTGVIADGGTVGGITFNYSFGPPPPSAPQLAITDGAAFGGGGPFDTTSSPNFLGTTDGDVLLDGDNFDLSFAAANALGMFFITSPGDPMFDGDILLSAGALTASLEAAAVEETLTDGGVVYFLGLIDTTASFTSASVSTVGGGFFFYNVDDITTAVVPEPGTFVMLAVGLTFLGVRSRSNRELTHRSGGE